MAHLLGEEDGRGSIPDQPGGLAPEAGGLEIGILYHQTLPGQVASRQNRTVTDHFRVTNRSLGNSHPPDQPSLTSV